MSKKKIKLFRTCKTLIANKALRAVQSMLGLKERPANIHPGITKKEIKKKEIKTPNLLIPH